MWARPRETTRHPGRYSPIFADCLFEEHEDMVPASMNGKREFEKNEMLFSAGDRPRHIYRLIKGAARLSFYEEPGNEPVSRAVEINEVLGLTEAILDVPYAAEAIALGGCVCEVIPSEQLKQILKRRKGLGPRLARAIAESENKNYRLMLSQ